MPRPTTLEVCRKYLYTDIDQVPDVYRERILRIRDGYTHWFCFPSKSRKQVATHICESHKTDIRTAYYDIEIIEILLGQIKESSKVWKRFRVNSMLEDAYALAEKQENSKAMTLAADKMGRYNMLDKTDPDKIPFEEIIPQPFEPTDDPTSLGITKDPEIRKKKNKMLEKYLGEIEITDVTYVDVLKDEREKEDIL